MQQAKKSVLFLNRLALILICTAVVLSTSIFIATTTKLKIDLNSIQENLFSVTDSIRTLRECVLEIRFQMEKLIDSREPVDVEAIRDSLDELNARQKTAEKIIQSGYPGESVETEELLYSLSDLRYQQEILFSHVYDLDSGSIDQELREQLDPICLQIKLETQYMMERTEAFSADAADRTYRLIRWVTVVYLFLSAFVLILFLLWFRGMYDRLKKQNSHYRNFLFNTFSEDGRTLFMVYEFNTGKIEFISSNASQLTGLSNEEVLGDPSLLLQGVDREQLRAMKHLILSDTSQSYIKKECRYLNPSTGESSWMLVYAYPISEKERISSRCIVVVLDLTETLKTKQALQDALIYARRTNQAKCDLLSQMSSEVRIPMNAIIGMSTLAAAHSDQPEYVESWLNKISGSARHLLEFVNNTLDMSKIENGWVNIQAQPFDLQTLLESVTSVIRSQAVAKNQEFLVCFPEELPDSLIGDSLHLHQILINLLSNSVAFTVEHGQIDLIMTGKSFKNDGRIALNFIITGGSVDMGSALHDALFYPLERESPSVCDPYTEIGLKMAITRNLISMMNGTLHVDSESNRSISFHLELIFDSEASEPVADNSIDVRDLKVLVADSSREDGLQTSIFLQQIGVRADWVLSGEDALDRIIDAHKKNEDYDVCFLDQSEAGDGLDIVRRIRRFAGEESPSIIIFTQDRTKIREEAQKTGVNGFLSKPISQSILYNTLSSLARESAELSSETDMPEDIEADFHNRRFLVAEDNALNMELVMELLRRTGAEVDGAKTGAAALRQFISHPEGTYDAILMDIQMPEMNGYQATREIRALDRRDAKSVSIIAMTSNTYTEDVVAALASGMNGHIAKPINMNIIYRTLQTELNRIPNENGR